MEFKNLFSDLLRPNYFEVIIEPPQKLSSIDTTPFKYLVVGTDLPFETIIPKEYVAMSRKFKIAGNVDYDPFTITFLLDSQGKLLDFLERWKKLVVNDENKMGYYNDYVGNMRVRLLDRQKNNIFEAKIFDCYPVNRNNLTLSNLTTDTLLEFSVSFEYFRAEYTCNGMDYTPDIDPLEFDSITKIYKALDKITPFNLQSKNYNSSYFGSNDFLTFNPFEKQIKEMMDKLGTNVGGVLNGIGLPQTQNIGNSLSKLVNEKIINTQKALTQPINTKINEIQNSITSKYKEIESQAKQRIQTGIQKTVNKIFKF